MESLDDDLLELKNEIQQEKAKRIELEQALREFEEKYNSLMGLIPCAVTITAVETGRILEVNEYFSKQTGYTREEAVG